MKAWSEYIERYKPHFKEMAFRELYSESTEINSGFNERIREADRSLSEEEIKNIGEGTIGIAVMQTLERNGWIFEKIAGEEPVMKNGKIRIEPMMLIENFRNEKISKAIWKEIMEKTEIENIVVSLN